MIGITLFGPVNDVIKQIDTSNMNPLSKTMLGLVPYLFVTVALLAGILSFFSAILTHLDDDTEPNEEDDEEETTKPKKKGKQTYKEYVKERLEVEEMLG
jgi:hypothetical protein